VFVNRGLRFIDTKLFTDASATIVDKGFLVGRAPALPGREDPFSHIVTAVQFLMNSPDQFHHSAVIFNSTGTGKSKTAVDLCKAVRAVYVGLEGHATSEVPRPLTVRNVAVRSKHYQRMFDDLKNAACSWSHKFKVALRIMYAFALASRGLVKEALYNSQLADFPGSVWKVYQSAENVTMETVRLAQEAKGGPSVPDHGPSRVRRVNFEAAADSLEGCEPLLIILDESATLIEESDPQRWNLLALRAACTELGVCFILFISACPALVNLALSRSRYLPPSRAVLATVQPTGNGDGRADFPPLFAIGPVDTFYEPWHPFSYGRPLWLSLFKANEETPDPNFLPKLVDTAMKLLINDPTVPSQLRNGVRLNLTRDQLLALIGVRFSLSASFGHAEALVRSHLALVNKIDSSEDGKFVLHSSYHPEPVLAEAAIRILCHDGAFVQALDAYATAIRRSAVQVRTDDVGGKMAAVYLSAVLDDCKRRALNGRYDGSGYSYSGGIPVRDFLSALGAACPDKLSGFGVNFTHVHRPVLAAANMTHMNLTRNYVKSLYYSCGAIYSPDSHSGEIGMIIPMWNEADDDVGVILVSTERTGDCTSSTGRDVLSRVMSGGEPASDTNDIPYILIVCDIGCGGRLKERMNVAVCGSLATSEADSPPAEVAVDLNSRHENPWIGQIQDSISRILKVSLLPTFATSPAEPLPSNILETAPIAKCWERPLSSAVP
jgi:hypothetical protein